MTDATVLDTPTTEAPATTERVVTVVPPAAAKGVKAPEKQAPRAKQTKPLPSVLTGPAEPPAPAPEPPKPASPIKARAPIVRTVATGGKIGPETLVTCNVDIRTVKVAGNKNWTRATGYPKPGDAPKTLAACIKDGITKGDALYDFERGWVELDPAPKTLAPRK